VYINLTIDSENERKQPLLALAAFVSALSECVVSYDKPNVRGIVGGTLAVNVTAEQIAQANEQVTQQVVEQQAASRRSRKAKADTTEPTTTQANAQAAADAAQGSQQATDGTIVVDPVTLAVKEYTEDGVQKLAVAVSRLKGPEIVKAKIAELGVTRIAELTPEKLNALGVWLETQK